MPDLRTLCLVILGLSTATPGAAQERWAADEWLRRPVDDRTFETYLQFFAYDRTVPLSVRALGTVDGGGVSHERLSFQSTPGVRVFANHYRAVGGGRQGRAAVVLVHGGLAEGKDAPSAKRIAEFLVRGGFDVLAIDMPHFGERSDGLLTTYTEQEKHEKLYNQPPVYLAFLIQLLKDVGRALDLLVAERGADPARIGYVGLSRGGQVGPIIMAVESRFAAGAFLYGGHFDRGETGHLAAACPANYVGRIAPRPLLMVNGTHDDDYDRARSVEPIYRLAKQPKQIIWANTGHQVPLPEHLSDVVQFLNEALR